ncbi:hypothetical protein FACS18942_05080 [Planctomycetales bacterium]|nr:hypothetical protein FACS18942_05080 [Planctomycetales bacterium]GHT37019.1 hypothetical protein FACS189427_09450 [Planctomycetales bacterium]
MRPSYNAKDALLTKKTSLPSATGTIYSEALDLGGIGEHGVRIDPYELLLTSPAATAAQLPASASNTYTLQFSDDNTFASGVVEWSAGTAWQQAGSASGATEAEFRFRPATDAPQYVRVKCVTAGAGAAQTGLSFEFALVS